MRVKVQVRVVLEISLDDTWEKDCTIHQVCEQAKDSVKQKIEKLLFKEPCVKIIGKNNVTAVIVDD